VLKTATTTHIAALPASPSGSSRCRLSRGRASQRPGRPARMTPAEYRAIMIRGQGVNERYGIGIQHGMTAAQYRAELIRGQALNEKYGLGVPARRTAAQYRRC
jgi:hypothetical protein